MSVQSFFFAVFLHDESIIYACGSMMNLNTQRKMCPSHEVCCLCHFQALVSCLCYLMARLFFFLICVMKEVLLSDFISLSKFFLFFYVHIKLFFKQYFRNSVSSSTAYFHCTTCSMLKINCIQVYLHNSFILIICQGRVIHNSVMFTSKNPKVFLFYLSLTLTLLTKSCLKIHLLQLLIQQTRQPANMCSQPKCNVGLPDSLSFSICLDSLRLANDQEL